MANLLTTATPGFQELVGNGKTYTVPPFQRDYSWKQEQWEDLWEDIMDLRPDAKLRHYMGAIVVRAETDREYLVIDGQQRMATLGILALAVIGRLETLAADGNQPNENTERAKTLRSIFVGAKDPASLLEIGKLRLNQHDDGFYQDYLVQLRRPPNPRSLKKSNKHLWDCFSFFERRIAEDSEFAHDGLKLAQLLSEVVARQLLFIVITVTDDMSAYTVFETLNARGLELTTTYLLKNFLFSRLRAESDLEAVQRRWQVLTATVRQERFAEFLRYHYLTRFAKIRSSRLYKQIRDEIKAPNDVLELINALESRAELFEALSEPNHGYWVDIPDARLYIRQLKLFRVRQMTPLLFAAWEILDRPNFVRILKLVCAITFRYTVVAGLNPNELESAYHGAARAILDRTAKTPRQIFEKLKSIYVPDQRFQVGFADMTVSSGGQGRQLAKYILISLESNRRGHYLDWETDPGTIEHVLPQNPSSDWEEMFDDKERDDAIHRIGNLALLEAPLNRESGDKPYVQKLEAYRQSSYLTASAIPNEYPETWSMEIIAQRQNRFAERAIHIWRSDYVDEA